MPIHEQVSAQIVFLIGTGKWAPGRKLPSVRALAQRLGVHRNTITQAYDELVLKLLVVKRAGTQLMIRGGESRAVSQNQSLDEVLNSMILEAGRAGFSLPELYNCLRERVLAAPADHLLALSADEGIQILFLNELRQHSKFRVEVCTPDELVASPDKAIGALVVSPPGYIPKIQNMLPSKRAPIPITYSAADNIVEEIRRLKKPSLIVIASISDYFLGVAQGVLAGAVGQHHSMRTYRLTDGHAPAAGAADLLICDTVTYPVLRPLYKPGVIFQYRLISTGCLEQISSALDGPLHSELG